MNHEARPLPETFVDGTCIAMLGSKPPKNNTSGIRGVSWSKQCQCWEAYIKFRGTYYHLGHYQKIEDAAKVRARAEELMFEPAIENWKSQKGIPDPLPIFKRKKNPLQNIYRTKVGHYHVRVSINGKIHYAGNFNTLPEAISARDKLRADHNLPPIEKAED